MREPAARPSIVVTADDLGFREDWDHAIARAWRHGLVTSVSVATTGDTYPAARELLLNEGLDHGVHLDLLDGRPVCRSTAEVGLVGRDGRFVGRIAGLVTLPLRLRGAVALIADEWRGQIARAYDDGLRPSHVNAHYHLHQLPPLLSVVVELARSFGIPWVRLADEPPWHADRVTSALKNGVLWALAGRGRSRLGGRVAFVRSRGIAASGRLDAPALRHVVDRLGGGVTEIVVHPGQSAAEDEALLSPNVRAFVDAASERRAFRDLQPGSP